MTGIDAVLLVVLAIALADKLFDLDHECWRDGCSECRAARDAERTRALR